jgi:hypothetical protein
MSPSSTVDTVVPHLLRCKIALGVSFEKYDTSDLTTVDGVATLGRSKGAWFKDSEGNLLAPRPFD